MEICIILNFKVQSTTILKQRIVGIILLRESVIDAMQIWPNKIFKIFITRQWTTKKCMNAYTND